MATHTVGTNANNSLTCITFLPGYASGVSAADMATIAELIGDDQGNLKALAGQAGAPFAAAFSFDGQLFVPNRGWLKVFPSDVVAVDSRGWPILLSKDTIANGPWHFV